MVVLQLIGALITIIALLLLADAAMLALTGLKKWGRDNDDL